MPSADGSLSMIAASHASSRSNSRSNSIASSASSSRRGSVALPSAQSGTKVADDLGDMEGNPWADSDQTGPGDASSSKPQPQPQPSSANPTTSSTKNYYSSFPLTPDYPAPSSSSSSRPPPSNLTPTQPPAHLSFLTPMARNVDLSPSGSSVASPKALGMGLGGGVDFERVLEEFDPYGAGSSTASRGLEQTQSRHSGFGNGSGGTSANAGGLGMQTNASDPAGKTSEDRDEKTDPRDFAKSIMAAAGFGSGTPSPTPPEPIEGGKPKQDRGDGAGKEGGPEMMISGLYDGGKGKEDGTNKGIEEVVPSSSRTGTSTKGKDKSLPTTPPPPPPSSRPPPPSNINRLSSSTPDRNRRGALNPPHNAPAASTSKQSSPRTSTEVQRGGAEGAGREGTERQKTPEIAFDFQGFLVQLRSKQAEGIQKYLKSFLVNFAKRPFSINEQIKLIHDFLRFIAEKMQQTDPWKSQNEMGFDNSMEAMEKLVMNRLYTYTFTPMIDPSQHPITTDDLERDSILNERIRIFSWVREKHLDVPEGEASQGFLAFAEQELLKINHYKAPRDKMICILNCCKVIFGLIRHEAGSDKTSADAFLPILIFVILRANPENMISNIEYINRFRSPSRLQGEAAYYLSSLGGAISFVETMDAAGLSNITQEEFEHNVEQAVAELPPPTPRDPRVARIPSAASTVGAPLANTAEGEEPARALTLPTNMTWDTKRFFQRTGEFAQEAVSRPLSALNKMLDSIGTTSESEDGHSDNDDHPGRRRQEQQTTPQKGQSPSIRAPQPQRTPETSSPLRGMFGRRTSSGAPMPPDAPPGVPRHPDDRLQVNEMYARHNVDFSRPPPGPTTPSDDPTFNFADLTAEIDRNTNTAHQAGVDTLHQMFPDIEKEIAEVILDSCQNDLGQAIDRMLEMATG